VVRCRDLFLWQLCRACCYSHITARRESSRVSISHYLCSVVSVIWRSPGFESDIELRRVWKDRIAKSGPSWGALVAVENSGSISSKSAYSIWNLYLFLLIFIGSINALSTRIHGRIPNGCVLHTVPADAKFVDDPEPEREDFLQRLRSYVRINSSLLRREPSQLLATTT
jgi:hypothetical protein